MGLVKDSGMYGYIDKEGKEVIKVQYEQAEPFSSGLGRFI